MHLTFGDALVWIQWECIPQPKVPVPESWSGNVLVLEWSNFKRWSLRGRFLDGGDLPSERADAAFKQ